MTGQPTTPPGQQPEPATAAQAITAARQMTHALNSVSADIQRLTVASRRNLVLIGLVIIALLGAGAALGYAIANGASLDDLHASQVSACQSGNTQRTEQARALDGVLNLFVPRGTVLPPAQRREIDALLTEARAKVATGWAPRDCAGLYRLSAP